MEIVALKLQSSERGEKMSGFFNKVKQSVDAGITTFSAKSKETVEIIRLRNQVEKLQKQKRDEVEGLGTIVYAMFINNAFVQENVLNKCQSIAILDQEIDRIEEEIRLTQLRTLETINALKTDINCQNCGEAIPKETIFCTHCGTKVNL